VRVWTPYRSLEIGEWPEVNNESVFKVRQRRIRAGWWTYLHGAFKMPRSGLRRRSAGTLCFLVWKWAHVQSQIETGLIDACVACWSVATGCEIGCVSCGQKRVSGGRQREVIAGFAVRQNLNGDVSMRYFVAALPHLQDCKGQMLSSHQKFRVCRDTCDDE
jgi:hypothetical protein